MKSLHIWYFFLIIIIRLNISTLLSTVFQLVLTNSYSIYNYIIVLRCVSQKLCLAKNCIPPLSIYRKFTVLMFSGWLRH